MNYEESIRLLTSKKMLKIQLGLSRIERILDIIGSPEDKIEVIHVAGTNGKGSVCSILANILKCSGYKTGLYTSPHLKEYTERIQINGVQISKSEFGYLFEEISRIARKSGIELSEFEIITAMAFKYFRDNNVDIAVIETGLGGRFDATNVCKKPLCSVITSISLDHTDKLGNTIENIAYEKAGIVKKHGVVIISKENRGYDVIEREAKKLDAKLIKTENQVDIRFKGGKNYAIYNEVCYEFGLLGLYQKYNLEIVFEVVEYLRTKGYKIKLDEGVRSVEWKGRMEYNREKNLIIDGAHNPDGAIELRKSLDYYFGENKRIFIYGTINTKDYKSIAEILFRQIDEVYYYEFSHNNAVSLKEYKEGIRRNMKLYTPEILKKNELKVLTGSLYMIGDFNKEISENGL